jgi:hypothetical protein
MKIALKAANGFYVSAVNGGDDTGAVRCVAGIGSHEVWDLARVNGGVTLQSSGGRFMSAEDGGGGQVHANRRVVGPWEIWTPSDSGFRCADGVHWLTADLGDPAVPLVANRTVQGEWERFTQESQEPAPPVVRVPHLEVRGNDFVDAAGQRIVFPATDQFFALRQFIDGGPDALKPAIEESNRLGFTAWRIWSQGSKRQNTIADLNPNEAGYYDAVGYCTDLLNANGIVPLWTCFVDNQDLGSTANHWYALGERLAGSATLLSLANQYQKNIGALDPWQFGSPGAGLIWSRGSSMNLDEQTPPRGAPASELHPTQISFERALMDATASPINMRATNGSTLVWMTEGHPFGDGNAYTEHQAWQLGRGYSIDWGLACFHNRQGQRMELMHDDTARCAAAWVRGMRL